MTTPLIQAILQVKNTPVVYGKNDQIDIRQLQKDVQHGFEEIANALRVKQTDDLFKQGLELVVQMLSSPNSPFAFEKSDGSFDLREPFKIQLLQVFAKNQLSHERDTAIVDVLSRITDFKPESNSSSELKKIAHMKKQDSEKPDEYLAKIFKELASKIAVRDNDNDFKEAILWVHSHYSTPLSPVSKKKHDGDFLMSEDYAVLFGKAFADLPEYTVERRNILIVILSGTIQSHGWDKKDVQRTSALKA